MVLVCVWGFGVRRPAGRPAVVNRDGPVILIPYQLLAGRRRWRRFGARRGGSVAPCSSGSRRRRDAGSCEAGSCAPASSPARYNQNWHLFSNGLSNSVQSKHQHACVSCISKKQEQSWLITCLVSSYVYTSTCVTGSEPVHRDAKSCHKKATCFPCWSEHVFLPIPVANICCCCGLGSYKHISSNLLLDGLPPKHATPPAIVQFHATGIATCLCLLYSLEKKTKFTYFFFWTRQIYLLTQRHHIYPLRPIIWVAFAS